MKYFSVTLGVVLTAVSSVSAHGYVQELTLGSTKWTGSLPYSDPYYNPVPARIVRPIPGNGPVTDLSKQLFFRVHHLQPGILSIHVLIRVPLRNLLFLGLIDVQCNGWSDGGVIGTT